MSANRSICLESWRGGLGDSNHYWRLALNDRDARAMDREQLEMIEDGLWLIAQALRGAVDGPLVTPKLRLPVCAGQLGEEAA